MQRDFEDSATKRDSNDRAEARADDLVVIPGWERYLNYVRISRDRLRGGAPQVNLNVVETLELFERLTLTEAGAFVCLLLEYANRPLCDSAGDALGARKLTRMSAQRVLSATIRNASRVLASLEQKGCVYFCQATAGKMSFQIGLDRTGLREDWNRRDVNGETEAVDDPTSDGNVQKRIAELLVAGNKIIGREPQFVPAGAASDSADPSSTATDDDIPF